MSGKQRAIFGMIFALFAGGFVGLGIHFAAEQHHQLRTFVATAGTVLSTKIETKPSSRKGGPTYRPVVAYRYEVAGCTYEQDQVTPSPLSSSRDWARRTIARYHPGQPVEIFYDPTDPSKAYLQRRASFFPYFFILFPMVHVSVGLAMALSRFMSLAMAMLCIVVLWYTIGLTAIGHFLAQPDPERDLLSDITSGAYLACGLVPLYILYRSKRGGGGATPIRGSATLPSAR